MRPLRCLPRCRSGDARFSATPGRVIRGRSSQSGCGAVQMLAVKSSKVADNLCKRRFAFRQENMSARQTRLSTQHGRNRVSWHVERDYGFHASPPRPCSQRCTPVHCLLRRRPDCGAHRVKWRAHLYQRDLAHIGAIEQDTTQIRRRREDRTSSQWNASFGWAPLQIMAVEGLRRYGFNDDADRISRKFITMIVHDFEEHGTIKEKYDVVTGKSDLAAGLKFGYTSNEAGFGWTNAAVVLFIGELAGQRPLAASLDRGFQTAQFQGHRFPPLAMWPPFSPQVQQYPMRDPSR